MHSSHGIKHQLAGLGRELQTNWKSDAILLLRVF